MEENMVKFSEKLKELLLFAKKKKNILELQEISDFFGGAELTVGHYEKIYEYLENNGVDVLHDGGIFESDNIDGCGSTYV